MKTALLIMVPHLSHYYPTFGLARWLRAEGYRVLYTGQPAYRAAVEAEGFAFAEVQYLDETLVPSFKAALGLWLKTRFDKTFTRARYRQFRRGMATIEWLLDIVQPDVIFLDDTLGHYYACVRDVAPVVVLHTKLSPQPRPGLPPLNSRYIPRGHFYDRWVAAGLWWAHLAKRRWSETLQQWLLAGYTDVVFQRRYERQRGLDWSTVSEPNTAFYDGLAGLPAVVLAPSALEFQDQRPLANEYYLWLTTKRNEDLYQSTACDELLDLIAQRKRAAGTKFIYAALGTLSLARAPAAQQLLQNIIDALAGDESLDVLVATGGLPVKGRGNVRCMEIVPQMGVLAQCDLMITHGGLGSVKECVSVGVPMLVYPLNTAVDQPGNSARVVQHGLGLRGHLQESPTRIRQRVYQLLNTHIYSERCHQMRQHLTTESQQANAILRQLFSQPLDSVESHKLTVSLLNKN